MLPTANEGEHDAQMPNALDGQPICTLFTSHEWHSRTGQPAQPALGFVPSKRSQGSQGLQGSMWGRTVDEARRDEQMAPVHPSLVPLSHHQGFFTRAPANSGPMGALETSYLSTKLRIPVFVCVRGDIVGLAVANSYPQPTMENPSVTSGREWTPMGSVTSTIIDPMFTINHTWLQHR
ncbi:hypothetical protein AK830_g7630 [Neonectria ditissima]|uniref:Uncharacterized protein n=1 Tax=Neonectria ditissima TaxID=78410 RepID=A0A0P7BDF6_9HYPO|nr:hypothetical protein AK830_g7630 [Neonectria ditissima]